MPPLLAIGILSEPSHRLYFDRRERIRATWLQRCQKPSCLGAFIFGRPPARADELSDAVVVNASETPMVTTISKTFAWLDVASSWAVAFVATADDDVILDPLGLLRDCRAYHSDIWATLEFVSFDLRSLRYRAWSDNQAGGKRLHLRESLIDAGHSFAQAQVLARKASSRQIARALRNTTHLRGPYAFPKGPTFVLSLRLARLVVAQGSCVQRLHAHVLQRALAIGVGARDRQRILHDLLIGLYLFECAPELPQNLSLYNTPSIEFRRWQHFGGDSDRAARAGLRYVHMGRAAVHKYKTRWGCYQQVWSNLSKDAWSERGAKVDELAAAKLPRLQACPGWGSWRDAPYRNWTCWQRDRNPLQRLSGVLERSPGYTVAGACT